MASLLALGVDFIQLRDADASDRALESFLDRLLRVAPAALGQILVNDRLAVASGFPVAGVHLKETSLPLPDVRRAVGSRFLLGRSVHSVKGAEQAARAGADYVLLGPAAPTGGKLPQPPGVFPAACRRSRAPVWAVGGLSPETLPVLAGSGISGVAAIGSFATLERAQALRHAVREAAADGLFVADPGAGPGGDPSAGRGLP